MPHRPPIRALNFVPSAVKFITALTGYLSIRPHGGFDSTERVIYKLLYRIWEDAGLYRESDVSREVSRVSRDTFTVWEFLVSYE